MGYTHYWTQRGAVSPGDWDVFCDGVRRLAALVGKRDDLALCEDYDVTDLPPVTLPSAVKFNGPGDEGHETLLIWREMRADQDLYGENITASSCKTSRKPYDVAVVACLAYLDHAHPDVFQAASDGSTADWADGVALAQAIWPEAKIVGAARRVRGVAP